MYKIIVEKPTTISPNPNINKKNFNANYHHLLNNIYFILSLVYNYNIELEDNMNLIKVLQYVF